MARPITKINLGFYGNIEMLAFDASDKKRRRMCLCRCSCGAIMRKRVSHIIRGEVKSCGCKTVEMKSKALIRHGYSRYKNVSSEYIIWSRMKSRCDNPADRNYFNYGGRGISICERWVNSFDNFIYDMGPKPSPKHSIDRIDNNGNYEPGNCRWATQAEQCNNTRRNARYYIDGGGETQAQLARRFGIDHHKVEWVVGELRVR